jgi:iron complex transport system substrate-binding protein
MAALARGETVRLVSFLASATEIIAALGCLDQLVGRSHECDYPPQVHALPVVSRVQIDLAVSSAEIDAQVKQLAQSQRTHDEAALRALSIYAIDVERLQTLRPDVIFTQTQCEVCAVSEGEVVEAIQRLIGLQPRVVSLTPYRLDDVWEDVVRVGKVLGRQARAEMLVKGYRQRLEYLSAATATGGKRPRVALLEWLDPLMGAGNWVPELVAAAGGEPLFGEIGQHSPWVSWDELHAADPDILVLAPCGYTLERTMVDVALLQRHPIWHSLRAVQNDRVYAIDGNAYLLRSGPRLVDSAEVLGRVFWGEKLGLEVDTRAWKQVQKK